ncbi:carbohydrate kinase [Rhizobium sp. SSA_523]|uniref:carbohydrate kinase n=1 Tax=Rhizobium sp. SSA_523 TaxID=2952477 RepID=UPI002090460C|nr:carbohydrate kinase [Rhizobium sp. SSA_523]MCO5732825.1 winged helix-turn-helix transcriptional regulator [Rhizobium sp. SSA_523]WKC23557.1 winged helix-turn-helix transcriptional regulator [Rhizobium sp. SSA_523]
MTIIKANPFAGQQEIADQLGLARSTIAAHIVQLINKGHILGRGYLLPSTSRVMCIGGAVFDRKYRARQAIVPETSNPVDGARSHGGVARNVAENLSLLGASVGFVSILGEDEAGQAILAHLRGRGIDTGQVILTAERPTAEYAAVLDPSGDLVLGLADMAIFDLFQPAHIDRAWSHLASAALVFADCNLPAETLHHLVRRRRDARFRLVIDAVSAPKVVRLPQDLAGVDLVFMNLDEANALLARHGHERVQAPLEAARALTGLGVREAVVSMGAHGMAIATGERLVHVPAVKARPVDMTGAGDAMIAATLYRLLAGDETVEAARMGTLAGALTTETDKSVHAELSSAFLDAHRHRLADEAAEAPDAKGEHDAQSGELRSDEITPT